MSHQVVEDFKYKGRRCIVVEVVNGYLPVYHNEYIELEDSEVRETYDDYPEISEELTFQDTLTHLDGVDSESTFIGFDTAHYHNIQNPSTQTKQAVINVCKQIVDELQHI